jgi:L-threonylcarbamoyladenylate synthase
MSAGVPTNDPIAAATALAEGRLAILPTETVYGLAADAANPAAVAALFEAKGRPRFNPLIAHVLDADAAAALGSLDERGRRLAAAFWPGPLTLVIPYGGGEAVCALARAGLDTIAVRAPAHPMARAVLSQLRRPIAAPSANRSGRPSPTTFADAVVETGASVAVALDGGPCLVGVESTVVALLEGPPRLLRPGGVTRRALEQVVGALAEAQDDGHRSPGRLVRHYAPTAPLRLDAETPRPGEAFLAFGPADSGPAVFQLSSRRDLREAAANLFSMLRRADALHPAAIAVAPLPAEGLGEAINDRLRRAAGHVG